MLDLLRFRGLANGSSHRQLGVRTIDASFTKLSSSRSCASCWSTCAQTPRWFRRRIVSHCVSVNSCRCPIDQDGTQPPTIGKGHALPARPSTSTAALSTSTSTIGSLQTVPRFAGRKHQSGGTAKQGGPASNYRFGRGTVGQGAGSSQRRRRSHAEPAGAPAIPCRACDPVQSRRGRRRSHAEPAIPCRAGGGDPMQSRRGRSHAEPAGDPMQSRRGRSHAEPAGAPAIPCRAGGGAGDPRRLAC